MNYSASQQTLLEQFGAMKSWEDRYRQILRLGKSHPMMDESLKRDDMLLAGCESKVWFYATKQNDTLNLNISSDAKIVKGLIAIIIQAYQGLSIEQARAFDCEAFFASLGLLNHLSPSRGNGIRAIISAIKQAAS